MMQGDMKQCPGKSWLGTYVGREVRSEKKTKQPNPMSEAGLYCTIKNKRRALLQLLFLLWKAALCVAQGVYLHCRR